MKYLDFEQVKTNLSLGKSIEQWLGFEKKDDYVVLKWISIIREKAGKYSTVYIECFDEGNEDFLDIYEFSMIDPDEPYGVINEFQNYDEAIEFAIVEYGASKERFVNSGMIQEEYLNYMNM